MIFANFYDNDIHNRDVNSLCPGITFFKIQDSSTTTCRPINHDKELHELMSAEPYAIKKIAHMYKKYHKHSRYDKNSGNNLESGEDFFTHVERAARHPDVSAIIFDWDRTLQPFESMSTHSFNWWARQFGVTNTKERHKFSRALAIYHAGGTKRFHKLRNMFSKIKKYSKPVFILTRNPAITSPGRDVYLHILHEWGVVPFSIEYTTDKYAHMSNDKYLQGQLLKF